MPRRVVGWTAIAATCLVTVGGAHHARAEERSSAWGPQAARPPAGHWSARAPAPSPAPAAQTRPARAPQGVHSAGAPASHTAPAPVVHTAAPAPARVSLVATPHAPARRGPRRRVKVQWTDPPSRRRPAALVVLEWETAIAAPHATPASGDGSGAPADEPAPPVDAPGAPAAAIDAVLEAAPSAAPAAAPPGAGLEPAQALSKGAPPKPGPIGLGRPGDAWPSWARVSLQYRGRAEYAEPLAAASKGHDGYYLNRMRLHGALAPTAWLQIVAETQDARILGYGAPAVSRFANTLDLRVGYAEIAVPGVQPFTIRGGRQEVAFGEGRLVASPDWGNTNRTFDGVRVSTRSSVGKTDFFAVSPVVITPGRFDAHTEGEWLYGGYVTLERAVPRSVLEWYALVRTQRGILSDAGALGDAQLVTFGSRAVVRLRPTLEAKGEGAMQRGDAAGDAISAWAAHAGIAWTPAHAAMKPKLSAEYNVASGDDTPGDGRRGTFDQLYASNHGKYGLIDAVGWRNLHDLAALAELRPARKLKVGGGLHYLALATVADGFYASSGSRVFLNRSATSRSIGWETDGWVNFVVSKELSVAAGVGVLFAGDYLQQSSEIDRLWSPYLLWNVKF